MALETRHTEKNILFSLLKAQKEEPLLAGSKEIKSIVLQLKATMEPEDVEIVLKRTAELE